MTAPSPDKKSAATSERRRSYNTGITADAVVTVAFGLSREHGVEGWSLRQLLGELDTSFSVVYRLVGDRDALSAAVVDSAVSAVNVPSAQEDWRRWLTHLLLQMREALIECPGAAQWLLMNGVATQRSRELMEAGLASLIDAGVRGRSRSGLHRRLHLDNHTDRHERRQAHSQRTAFTRSQRDAGTTE